ncbi:hypothetical protein BS47DRAFT_1402990 [Hydnum rufescens UP504]|uniref:Uncharacterized protein n=1 Tax=Hydnum rufescens UP504 TaxID=1448309 RepID=A0A9P6ABG7_9AGAM|nr:hypothetical protein BS47DRAFT_1402990 [Hydnum rufescens UP504]
MPPKRTNTKTRKPTGKNSGSTSALAPSSDISSATRNRNQSSPNPTPSTSTDPLRWDYGESSSPLSSEMICSIQHFPTLCTRYSVYFEQNLNKVRGERPTSQRHFVSIQDWVLEYTNTLWESDASPDLLELLNPQPERIRHPRNLLFCGPPSVVSQHACAVAGVFRPLGPNHQFPFAGGACRGAANALDCFLAAARLIDAIARKPCINAFDVICLWLHRHSQFFHLKTQLDPQSWSMAPHSEVAKQPLNRGGKTVSLLGEMRNTQQFEPSRQLPDAIGPSEPIIRPWLLVPGSLPIVFGVISRQDWSDIGSAPRAWYLARSWSPEKIVQITLDRHQDAGFIFGRVQAALAMGWVNAASVNSSATAHLVLLPAGAPPPPSPFDVLMTCDVEACCAAPLTRVLVDCTCSLMHVDAPVTSAVDCAALTIDADSPVTFGFAGEERLMSSEEGHQMMHFAGRTDQIDQAQEARLDIRGARNRTPRLEAGHSLVLHSGSKKYRLRVERQRRWSAACAERRPSRNRAFLPRSSLVLPRDFSYTPPLIRKVTPVRPSQVPRWSPHDLPLGFVPSLGSLPAHRSCLVLRELLASYSRWPSVACHLSIHSLLLVNSRLSSAPHARNVWATAVAFSWLSSLCSNAAHSPPSFSHVPLLMRPTCPVEFQGCHRWIGQASKNPSLEDPAAPDAQTAHRLPGPWAVPVSPKVHHAIAPRVNLMISDCR